MCNDYFNVDLLIMKEIYTKLESLWASEWVITMLKFRESKAVTIKELAEVLETGKGIVSTLEEKQLLLSKK